MESKNNNEKKIEEDRRRKYYVPRCKRVPDVSNIFRGTKVEIISNSSQF